MPEVLREKTLSDVTYKNEFEALKVLEQLIDKIIKEDFKNDPRLRDYVKKRVEGAEEVLRRVSKDYLTDRELRSTVPSSKVVEKGAPKEVKVRTLDGRETKTVVGATDEDLFYHVYVSRFRFKCTCKDAVMLSSAADRRLKDALQAIGVDRIPTSGMFFYRYIICKHTLAKIAKAMANPSEGVGVVAIDKEFVDSLKLALFGAYLRSADKIDPEVVKNAYKLLIKRLR